MFLEAIFIKKLSYALDSTVEEAHMLAGSSYFPPVAAQPPASQPGLISASIRATIKSHGVL